MKKYKYIWFDPSCSYTFSKTITEGELRKMYRHRLLKCVGESFKLFKAHLIWKGDLEEIKN